MHDLAPKEWHREVISDATEATLRSLRDAALLDNFYLAGGTGLALHLGHRLSHDLDFFTEALFNEGSMLQRAQRIHGFSLVSKAPHTLNTTVEGVKLSFIGYAYPMLFPVAKFQEVAVADPRDIACMKVSAIASRGTRRDFVDLYVAAQAFGLQEFLRLFQRKYTRAAYNRLHVLKSLTYFEDAEKDPMPHMLTTFDWEEAKRYFIREIPRLA